MVKMKGQGEVSLTSTCRRTFQAEELQRGSRGWVGRVRAEERSRAAMPGPRDPL